MGTSMGSESFWLKSLSAFAENDYSRMALNISFMLICCTWW